MEDLKAKLELTEQELEEKWKLFDEQKNAELDKIEFERFKLQELENQERFVDSDIEGRGYKVYLVSGLFVVVVSFNIFFHFLMSSRIRWHEFV